MSQGPVAALPESPPSGPAAASGMAPPPSAPGPEPDDEPELELPLVDPLPLEGLDPLPDEDALEDPPSNSFGEAAPPLVEHAKAVHAKVRAARWTIGFIE